jgi:hypothetical protein
MTQGTQRLARLLTVGARYVGDQATLADQAALQALSTWDFDRVDDVYIPAQLPEAPGAIGAVTDERTGANVVTVNSGWGDGVYPTFIGYTAHGEVASFVTDFMVVPPDEPTAR